MFYIQTKTTEPQVELQINQKLKNLKWEGNLEDWLCEVAQQKGIFKLVKKGLRGADLQHISKAYLQAMQLSLPSID
ncbi:MAG: hypothetical protein AAF380_01080 [Bacteroidota bacterium]